MSAIQDELVKASKFKGEYKNRQDWLAALLKAMDNIKIVTDDVYDSLSDAAVEWHQTAVKCMDRKEVIPDFPDAPEAEEEPQTEKAEEPEAEDEGAEAGTPEKAAKPKKKPKVSERNQPDYTKLTGETDRYGVAIGTRTHMAVQMYEKGCTAKEIMDELGGRFYNILKKLAQDGHHFEKNEEFKTWKLTHKDDYTGKKAKTDA